MASGTRPDLIFPQVEVCTKYGRSQIKDLIQALELFRKVKQYESFFMIKRLGPVEDWKIYIWTDASLSNLNDGVDSTMSSSSKTAKATVPQWFATQTRSSELWVQFVGGTKEAAYLREVLEEIFEKSIPVEALRTTKALGTQSILPVQ